MVGAVAAKVFVSNMHLMANRLASMPPKAKVQQYFPWMFEKIITHVKGDVFLQIKMRKYIGEYKLEGKNRKPLAKPHPPAIADMQEAKVDNMHRTPPYSTWVEGLQGYQRASAKYCHEIESNGIFMQLSTNYWL